MGFLQRKIAFASSRIFVKLVIFMEPAAEFKPTILGTIAILIACAFGFVLSEADAQPSKVAQNVAYVLLAGITVSILMDWTKGLRNLVRLDILAFLALYFLSYFEFLFPQSNFDLLVDPDSLVKAIKMTTIGYGALAIGRHIRVGSKTALDFVGSIQMRNKDILVIYFAAFVISHFYMWMSVNFNFLQWFQELMQARFSQSWSRSKYGSLATLAGELMLLSNVIPPIAGLVYAKWREFGKVTVFWVTIPLIIVLFEGFCSGTRNVLAIHLAGILAGFFIVQKQLRVKWIILMSVSTVIIFVVLADVMLEFRTIGLKRYIDEGRYKPAYKELVAESYIESGDERGESGYFVDYNLLRIAQLVDVFPDVYEYNGWNLPFVAITKPIPRAFWPGKPTDLKVGLEEAVGAKGMTIACTWIGEAYVSGGVIWIIGIGLLIGIFCRFWNQLAKFVRSPFALIVFASGIFAVLALMRSLMFFTTALLPAFALIAMGIFIHKNRPRSDNNEPA